MVNGIQFKVCGLTSPADAGAAAGAGADFLGFNLHERSPRYVTLDRFRGMAPRLPARKKVAVVVEPRPAALREMLEAGFDFIQVHFDATEERADAVAEWSAAAGVGRLWLAPRLPPGAGIPPAVLRLADTFLVDAFSADRFGGTGKTADWALYRRCSETHPEKAWILAGGLSPENIKAALKATGARFVDVNSGVEASPGVKDHARIAEFAARLAES